MESLVLWLTAAMIAWVPPSQKDWGSEVQRYATIAWAALDVAYDPAEAPLFEGPHGRSKTALQILAISGFESSFRQDVQLGTKRGKAGDACDMQVIIPKARHLRLTASTYEWVSTREPGLSAEDLVGPDPRLCFRVGLHLVRESFHICHDLSMYTSGKCDKNEVKAQHRLQRAKRHYELHPAPVLDNDVLKMPFEDSKTASL